MVTVGATNEYISCLLLLCILMFWDIWDLCTPLRWTIKNVWNETQTIQSNNLEESVMLWVTFLWNPGLIKALVCIPIEAFVFWLYSKMWCQCKSNLFCLLFLHYSWRHAYYSLKVQVTFYSLLPLRTKAWQGAYCPHEPLTTAGSAMVQLSIWRGLINKMPYGLRGIMVNGVLYSVQSKISQPQHLHFCTFLSI